MVLRRYCLIFFSLISGRRTVRSLPQPGAVSCDTTYYILYSMFLKKNLFVCEKLKTKIKMPNGWRTINSLVHKIRLHGRRGKGMAESFSRQKSRHAPQKEGGLKILCDLPPVWPRLVRPTNLMSRMDGKKTHTHTHTHSSCTRNNARFSFSCHDKKKVSERIISRSSEHIPQSEGKKVWSKLLRWYSI